MLRLRLSLVWLIAAVSPSVGYGQLAPADSAEAIYWQAYEAYAQGSPEQLRQAVLLWRRAATMFRETGLPKQQALALEAVAVAYQALGRDDSVQVYLELVTALRDPWALSVPVSRIPSGFALAVRTGPVTVGADSDDLILGGMGIEGSVWFTLGRLQLGASVARSSHAISDIPERYQLLSMVLEPRMMLPSPLARLTPFFGARAGVVWERVVEPGVEFRATGRTLGGSGGFLLRVDRQVSLEGGFRLGTLAFGDFDLASEALWERCARNLRTTGTPLPEAAVLCSPRGFRQGQAQLVVDHELGNSGVPERIPHPNSSRSGNWMGAWVGLSIALLSH